MSERLSWSEEQQAVAAAVASFPATFGLRGFPGRTFRACPRASYYGQNGVIVYTAVRTESGVWSDWTKGSPAEVRREMTADPNEAKNG